MLSAILDISKYAFAMFIIVYAALAFIGLYVKSRLVKANIYALQIIITLALHLMGYFVLFTNSGYEQKYVTLYFMQLVYFLAVYLVYNLFYKNASKLLVNNMCLLIAIGFIMIGRLSYSKCFKQFVICAAGTFITFFIPVILKKAKWLKNLGWLYCVAGLALLIAVLFCSEVFGANLVLTIGSFSIQPAEFVKILYVLFVAAMFNKAVNFKRIVLVTFFAALHVIVLVLSTDLGAALIFFVVYLLMLYTATRKVIYIFLGAGAGSAASVAAYYMFNHVRQRVQIWLNPWNTIDSTGYQICQSLFAIGMGSWFGYGLGQGLPGKIPVAEKDFMFSAITEEMGVLFSIALLLVCLNNLVIMMNIASRCRTLFYRLIAVGLGVTYGFQVFLTVGGAMKLIPMTGVTLPFVSYGGSSIVSALVMFALINGMYIMRQDGGEKFEPSEEKSDIRKKHEKRSEK